jgi:hypothetical protein
VHGFFIIKPIPWHLEQGICITIAPCLIVDVPDPPQDMHLVGAVPGLHLLPLHAVQAPTFSYFKAELK